MSRITEKQMKWPVALLLPPLIAALSYRCDNDQVLIVQSFGNDSIRMHCQRLNLCGFAHLVSYFSNTLFSLKYIFSSTFFFTIIV